MPHFFMISLLLGACAGVISEIITLAAPAKIINISRSDLSDQRENRRYRFLFLLSGMYLAGVVLLLFSGNGRFRTYALVMMVFSLSMWVFRSQLKNRIPLLMTESTINLILLIDIIRRIARQLF